MPLALGVFLVLVLVGVGVGVTTVVFGFGGGFVTVPVITVVDISLGGDGARVAAATSALVMLVNAAVATAATRRDELARLRGRLWLFVGLALGGAVGAAATRWAPVEIIRWGFVVYVAVTAVDLVVRPGFFRRGSTTGAGGTRAAHGGVPSWLGLPVGAVAAFLGVGGSVMTVPMMRRSGASMQAATTLANPLTLAIVAPALAVALAAPAQHSYSTGFIGAVDVASALALLAGSMPMVVLLRRRPPRIPDRVHAWSYLVLLAAAAATVAVVG